mmetsp:Transcript_13534/g.35075  ORF Transcript_13534/g.35075 Transcript_13534/m.35075 type:complete len:323 (+) Transcript_13534:1267-2235(+)
MSGTGVDFRNQSCFSSSVSTTFGGSSSTSSGSSSTSISSSGISSSFTSAWAAGSGAFSAAAPSPSPSFISTSSAVSKPFAESSAAFAAFSSASCLILSALFFAISSFLCCSLNCFWRAFSTFRASNAAIAAACLSCKALSTVWTLNLSSGSPTMTQATLRKCGTRKFLTMSMRSFLVKLPLTSMMIMGRRCEAAAMANKLFTLPSSSWGMPRFMSGRSFEERLFLGRHKPLLMAQSKSFLSLNSVYCGLLAKKKSNHSKVPSSGRHTGKSTSYLPSLGAFHVTTSTSALAASCKVLHLNGNGVQGSGPKFMCTVMPLKVTVG